MWYIKCPQSWPFVPLQFCPYWAPPCTPATQNLLTASLHPVWLLAYAWWLNGPFSSSYPILWAGGSPNPHPHIFQSLVQADLFKRLLWSLLRCHSVQDPQPSALHLYSPHVHWQLFLVCCPICLLICLPLSWELLEDVKQALLIFVKSCADRISWSIARTKCLCWMSCQIIQSPPAQIKSIQWVVTISQSCEYGGRPLSTDTREYRAARCSLGPGLSSHLQGPCRMS